MALQSNFFGSKRDADTPLARPVTPVGAASVTMPSSASASPPNAGLGALGRDAAPAPVIQEIPATPDNPSKLTVGPNIKLKGVEITDCDTLVVEGLVEATMDSRVMLVEEEGAFKGSAQVDFAEIRGRFEGTLNARTRLVIRATGKVTGNVRYGSIVIEEGGQLGGEVQFGPAGTTSASHSASSNTNAISNANANANTNASPGAIVASSAPTRLERAIAA